MEFLSHVLVVLDVLGDGKGVVVADERWRELCCGWMCPGGGLAALYFFFAFLVMRSCVVVGREASPSPPQLMEHMGCFHLFSFTAFSSFQPWLLFFFNKTVQLTSLSFIILVLCLMAKCGDLKCLFALFCKLTVKQDEMLILDRKCFLTMF